MISPYKIKWLGETSLEHDCWTGLAFDGDSGDVESHLGREAVASVVYNGTLKRTHSYKWNNDYIPTITFIKQDYSDFSEEENRKMLKWITKNKNASFLDIYRDDSEAIEYSILGNFVNVSQYKLGNGRIVGYVCEFESLTPFAFSPLKIITKDVSDPTDNKIKLNIITDDPQSAIYPRITINQDSLTNIVTINHALTDTDTWVDGTVYKYNNTYYWIDAEGVKHTSSSNTSGFETTSVIIKNTYTDDNKQTHVFETVIKNNIKGETVVLDGANGVISSSRPNGRIFGDDFVNWSWIPLYDGDNELSFIGNCTVTVERREPRKIGEY